MRRQREAPDTLYAAPEGLWRRWERRVVFHGLVVLCGLRWAGGAAQRLLGATDLYREPVACSRRTRRGGSATASSVPKRVAAIWHRLHSPRLLILLVS